MNFFATPHQNWLDNNGKPLAGGRLFVYDAGTTTPTNTWQDAAHSQLNTNPIILDAGGFTSIWLDPTKSYKFRMVDALGNQQWTVDNYVGATLTGNMVVPLNFILPATGTNTIDNGMNWQSWKFSLTGTNTMAAFDISESSPSTNTGAGSTLFTVFTEPGSTIWPFRVTNPSRGLGITPIGDIQALGGANFITNITGSIQCVQALADGTLVGTGTPCGAGAGGFVDNETVAGSGYSWTLAQTPNPAASLQLFQNGVLLVQGVDYTLTGASITTTYAASGLTAWYRTSGGGVTPPPTPQLSSLTVSPASVLGGSANSTGTVTLTVAAPTGGVLVTLTSSNTGAATVPASVTVAAGSLTATFTVTSVAVGANTTSTITASYSGTTRTANLTVTAPVVAQPIYGGVGAQGATSGTLSGTQVTLNNGAVLAQMKTTPEAVNDQFPSASTFFSPSDQCIYLLLTAAGHTFVDQNNNAFAFDPPLQITVSGRTLYLYASSNPLYMTWRLKLTG